LSGTLIRVGRLTGVRLDLAYPGVADRQTPTASFKAAAKLADELFANTAGDKRTGDVCCIGVTPKAKGY